MFYLIKLIDSNKTLSNLFQDRFTPTAQVKTRGSG